MRVLIIPDKFKVTLTAAQAARSMARGWHRARPQDILELLPMSDGGDGFGETLAAILHARSVSVRTTDAAGRPLTAKWWWEPKTKTAIIESAAVIGLAMLPKKNFHPFDLDTFGLGKVVEAVAKRGARRCLMGLGGSATNDGGFGLARSLGWIFLDPDSKPITHWTELRRLRSIRPPENLRRFNQLSAAVDVRNTLLGPRGASRVYGPQKGLARSDFARAEQCLARLAQVTQEQLGRDLASQPGSGAAGGLGFGLGAFLGARLEPGFELFARLSNLNRRLRQADLVLTGEGGLDASTLMGKGVGEVAKLCRQLGLPCVALAGVVQNLADGERAFTAIRALTELTNHDSAKARAAYWLEKLAASSACSESVVPAAKSLNFLFYA